MSQHNDSYIGDDDKIIVGTCIEPSSPELVNKNSITGLLEDPCFIQEDEDGDSTQEAAAVPLDINRSKKEIIMHDVPAQRYSTPFTKGAAY